MNTSSQELENNKEKIATDKKVKATIDWLVKMRKLAGKS